MENPGIRFSSRNNGRIKTTTRLVLYKTQHYFCAKLASFCLFGSRNVISTKHYFQHKENITNFSYEIQNPKHYFQLEEITTQREYEIQNLKTLFQLEEITSQCEYEIQNPKHYFNSRKLLQISVTNFKTIDVILMCLEILLYKHKAVKKVPGIAKQTVNRK